MVHRGNPTGKRVCVGWTWRKLSADVKRQCCTSGHWCEVCRGRLGPIRHDEAAPVKLRFSVDHIVSKKAAPHLALVRDNLRPAHHGCNSKLGAGPGHRKRPPRASQPVTSERW